MEALKNRILQSGQVLSSHVLKVDSFLNHQVDPNLTMEIGKAFADEFRSKNITKILTIEASGIHFAFATAHFLNVPFVYAKKKKAITQADGLFTASVYSFTREETYQISVSKSYVSANDTVLIIDDILANGEALLGLKQIIEQAGASLIGVGIVIEKSFQAGRQKLEQEGINIYSLARIQSMSPGTITFVDESIQSKEKEKIATC